MPKISTTKEHLQTHLKLHKNIHNVPYLYRIDQKAHTDRRRMIYQGTPIQNATQVHGLISYSEKINYGRVQYAKKHPIRIKKET